MRVTESIMYRQMARDVQSAQANMELKARPVRTGFKNSLPSDDPAYTEQASRLKRAFSETVQYRRNVGRVKNYYSIVESTVQHVSDALDDLQALAISMANDHLSAADRQGAAAEATQISKTLAGFANVRFDGRYVFAGRASGQPAYDDLLDFQGDAIGREIPVSDNLNVEGDLPGPQLFGDPAAGQVTAFQAADNLIQALVANDTNLIRDALSELNDAHNLAASAHAKVGGVMRELQNVDFIHDDDEFNKTRIYADLTNADITRGASELAYAETVLTASVETARQLNRNLGTALNFFT